MRIWNFEVQNSDKDFHNPANTGCAREPLSDIEEKSKIFDLKRTGSVGLLFTINTENGAVTGINPHSYVRKVLYLLSPSETK